MDQLIPEGWWKSFAGPLQQLDAFGRSASSHRRYGIHEFDRVATAKVFSPAIDLFLISHRRIPPLKSFSAVHTASGQASSMLFPIAVNHVSTPKLGAVSTSPMIAGRKSLS